MKHRANKRRRVQRVRVKNKKITRRTNEIRKIQFHLENPIFSLLSFTHSLSLSHPLSSEFFMNEIKLYDAWCVWLGFWNVWIQFYELHDSLFRVFFSFFFFFISSDVYELSHSHTLQLFIAILSVTSFVNKSYRRKEREERSVHAKKQKINEWTKWKSMGVEVENNKKKKK
jgi:hypothetical protein